MLCRYVKSEDNLFLCREAEWKCQCALPVLEGLFADESHDRQIQNLVFTMAEWHANAKLRLHTDSTILTLKELT